MQNQLLSFLKAVDTAACQWFGEYGGALDALGYALVMAKNPLSTTVGSGLLLANAAAEMGCDFDPNKTGTPMLRHSHITRMTVSLANETPWWYYNRCIQYFPDSNMLDANRK